jgi:hypothetical protein
MWLSIAFRCELLWYSQPRSGDGYLGAGRVLNMHIQLDTDMSNNHPLLPVTYPLKM